MTTIPEASDLSKQVTDKLMEALDQVILERRKHFLSNKIPERKSVPQLIESYSMMNATISAGASLVPGPLGMLAVLPEIIAVCRNQIALIYDIGMAYGKSNVLTKELIAGIFYTALGGSLGSVIIIQGNKVLVRRASLRVLQKIVALLGGKITQRALKSFVSKWLPVAGVTAMGAWSYYQTKQIGKKAAEIFEKDIVLSDGIIDVLPTDETVSNNGAASSAINIEILRMQALINLMKVDGVVRAQEREYIQTIISKATLTEEEKNYLSQAIDTGEKFSVDYAALADSPDDALVLLMQMASLARRDGIIHDAEKMYIMQAGRLMRIPDSEIEDILRITDRVRRL